MFYHLYLYDIIERYGWLVERLFFMNLDERKTYINIPQSAKRLVSIVNNKKGYENVKLFMVGGYVRNALLNLEDTDLDICSSLMPEDVFEIFGEKAKLVNKNLGTVHINIGGETFEHTTFRSESYGNGGSHKPVEVKIGVSMEEDAKRRDFTMNALYAELKTGMVYDPTGRGIDDVFCRRIMTTSKEPSYIMKDDGLRLMRMVRFSAELGFSIDDSLMASARENASLIDAISKERVYEELKKILLADTKYRFSASGHIRGIKALRSAGLLRRIFDVYPFNGENEADIDFVINCFCCMPADFSTRLASLFILADAESAKNALLNLKAEQSRIKLIYSVISNVNFGSDSLSEFEIRRQIQRMGVNEFALLCELRRGIDAESGIIGTWRSLFEVLNAKDIFPVSAKELAVSGKDLMQSLDLKPSPLLGEIIDKLLILCAEEPALNRREVLLEKAKVFLG